MKWNFWNNESGENSVSNETYGLGDWVKLVDDGTEVVVIALATRVNCYQVQFPDGFIEWYHEDELE